MKINESVWLKEVQISASDDNMAASFAEITLSWRARRAKPCKVPLTPGPLRLPILGNILNIPKHYLSQAQSHRCPQLVEDCDGLLEKRSSIYSDSLGLDWSAALMPYGNKWKLSRRMFQQQVGRVDRNRAVQLREAHGFLVRLLQSPKEFLSHIHHMTGAALLDVAYALNIQSREGHFARLAEDANNAVSKTANSGSSMREVDVIVVKNIPSWMPGAGFKCKAASFRRTMTALLEEPFVDVQRRIVHSGTHISHTTLQTKLIYFAGSRRGYKLRPEYSQTQTASTLTAFFLVMVLFPEVQVKAQKQLDSVLHGDRFPEMHDQPSLLNVSAGSLFSPLMMSMTVTSFQNFMIIANIRALSYDEADYPDPSAYRFIKDGKWNSYIPDPATAAFGFGRRMCPGRRFAQDQLWITIVSVLASSIITKALDENGIAITPDGEDLPGLIR
ncbi:cytochrome P450 [Obba rivulosa]|uniref:Cytochrome P450 n=1 Tax=Obba rivulosa TaxID=1052685 RepID=A0A8E2AXS9_9APHY|nr:cytochrome P450 [Obba rivulosa]